MSRTCRHTSERWRACSEPPAGRTDAVAEQTEDPAMKEVSELLLLCVRLRPAPPAAPPPGSGTGRKPPPGSARRDWGGGQRRRIRAMPACHGYTP